MLSICSKGFALLNKMAAMHRYDKILKISSPELRKLGGCILVYSSEDSTFTKFVQMMILG